jgi:hypothetical protein
MTNRRIPTWLLERVILDEVPPELADEVRQVLDENPAERARLAELERSSAEILSALPPARVAAEVARRAGSSGGLALMLNVVRPGGPRLNARRRVLALSSSLAVAAGVVLVAVAVGRQVGPSGEPVAGGGDTGHGQTGEVTTAKGDPRLILHRKGEGEAPELPVEAVVGAGDRIQVKYVAGGRLHGAILSIDGRGVVTLHFPADERGSTLLGQGGAVALDHSYELDDAPAFERFVFVTSDQSIRLADVLASARSLAADPQRRDAGEMRLAAGQRQTWYTLRKKEVAP